MDDGICAKGDSDGGLDALGIQLDKPQLEHDNGNTNLQHVREVEEVKGPAEQNHLLRAVRKGNEGEQCAEGPKEQEVAGRLILRPHGEGKYHSVEGAKMEGEILKRSAPCHQVIDDSRPSGKGQNTKNNVLRLLGHLLKDAVQGYVDQGGGNQGCNMNGSEKSPKWHNGLLNLM